MPNTSNSSSSSLSSSSSSASSSSSDDFARRFERLFGSSISGVGKSSKPPVSESRLQERLDALRDRTPHHHTALASHQELTDRLSQLMSNPASSSSSSSSLSASRAPATAIPAPSVAPSASLSASASAAAPAASKSRLYSAAPEVSASEMDEVDALLDEVADDVTLQQFTKLYKSRDDTSATAATHSTNTVSGAGGAHKVMVFLPPKRSFASSCADETADGEAERDRTAAELQVSDAEVAAMMKSISAQSCEDLASEAAEDDVRPRRVFDEVPPDDEDDDDDAVVNRIVNQISDEAALEAAFPTATPTPIPPRIASGPKTARVAKK